MIKWLCQLLGHKYQIKKISSIEKQYQAKELKWMIASIMKKENLAENGDEVKCFEEYLFHDTLDLTCKRCNFRMVFAEKEF